MFWFLTPIDFSILYEQASLEQSNSKGWANINYCVAVLILDVKVHIKSVHRLNVVNLRFIPDSLLEMPIGIDILISEESPYFSH